MAAKICTGCDYHLPKHYNVIGRECAAFIKCTEAEECGLRCPPLERKGVYSIDSKDNRPAAEARLAGDRPL